MESRHTSIVTNSARVKHINALMNDIHDSTSALYEALIDEEESEAISVIKSLQKKLKSILISITDE